MTWIRAVGGQRLDAEGRPVRMVGIVFDISYRKWAEEALRASEARFREMLENVELAAVTLDPHGVVTFCNDHLLRLTGWTRDEALGANWFARFEPGTDEGGPRHFNESVVRGEIPRHREGPVLTKSGETREILWSSTILKDAAGSPQGTANIGEDVTERRKAELRIAQYTAQLQTANRHLQNALDKAESAERVKSAFLAAMSHELRTPLNSVIGFTGALLGGLVGTISGEQREALEIVQRNGRHLLELINEVLDLSKIEAGEMRLSRQEYDLCQVVRDAIRSPGPAAEAKGLGLALAESPVAVRLDGDARRASQVVLNLLSNAVKFTDRGMVTVRIRVGGEGDPRFVSVAVSDTGPGILAADLEGIFREFVQLDSETARTQEGTGLGLALSRKLARLMGGDVGVVSERGSGSTFTFRLPLPGGDA